MGARTSALDPRAKLTPTYKVGCKRLIISSDYYPALQKPGTADGVRHVVDTIILGTGYDAAAHWPTSKFAAPMAALSRTRGTRPECRPISARRSPASPTCS